MPFKSEAQRKYLWANEPEIARDWTDTYGSKIHKADGGRIGMAEGWSPGAGRDERGYQPGHTSHRDFGGPPGTSSTPTHIPTPPKKTIKQHVGEGIQKYRKKGIENYLDRNQFRQMQNLGLINNPSKWSIINNLVSGATGKVPEWAEGWSADELIALTGTGPYAGATNAPTGKQLEKGADRLRVTEDFRGTLDEPNLQTRFNEQFPGPKVDTGGGGEGLPYIWPYETASVPIEEEEIVVADSGLGSGHFRVPEQYRVAEGGRIPAAFGGVMDTYTGRRKYGLGSIFKKATKPFKKILKSPIGKLAAMAGLGYLATPGTGAGWQKWLKPGGKGDWWKRVLLGKETGIAPNPGERAGGVLNMLKNPWVSIPAAGAAAGLMTAKQPVEELDDVQGQWDADKAAFDAYLASLDDEDSYRVPDEYIKSAQGGRIGKQEGGLMDLGGMEKDYRNDGGFVPIGGQEKADDVPARLSKNEFVFTADAVRNAGGGDIDRGAEVMENVMKNLEGGGKISEESQGQGAQEMFEVSERLSEVI